MNYDFADLNDKAG